MNNKRFMSFFRLLTLFVDASGKYNYRNDDRKYLSIEQNYTSFKATYKSSNFQHFNVTSEALMEDWNWWKSRDWWIAQRSKVWDQWIGARRLQPMALQHIHVPWRLLTICYKSKTMLARKKQAHWTKWKWNFASVTKKVVIHLHLPNLPPSPKANLPTRLSLSLQFQL